MIFGKKSALKWTRILLSLESDATSQEGKCVMYYCVTYFVTIRVHLHDYLLPSQVRVLIVSGMFL